MSDKRTLYTVFASTLAVLLLIFLLPGEMSSRIATVTALAIAAALTRVFIKKRSILSMNKGQILMLMTVIGLLCLVLLYVTGLFVGFVRNPYARISFLWSRALPIAVTVVLTEYLRYAGRAQNDRAADVLSYFVCVSAEVLALGNVTYISSHGRFMDFMGIVLFPALISNVLYHYLSKRYGMLPNTVYRLLTSLYLYVIPVTSALPDAILAFAKVIIPLLIYAFLDALYEKKRRYALKRKSKLGTVLTVACILILASLVALISNQFRFGALVIATPSMTGELNVGDVAIFEQHVDFTPEEGQIIVFEKDGAVVVHRVVDIQTINGRTRYYTKGDANEDPDAGFLYRSDIIGHVDHKIPFVGYPTIWFRSLFA